VIKPERHEGGFMSKNGPAIILDEHFVLNKLSLLQFLPFCIKWARSIHEVAGRISLKFTYGEDKLQRANFMWQGTLFVQIISEQVHLEEVKQYCYCLLDQNLNTSQGRYYPMAKLWEEVFQPNLRAAIQQESVRLSQLEEKLNTTMVANRVEDFRYFIQPSE